MYIFAYMFKLLKSEKLLHIRVINKYPAKMKGHVRRTKEEKTQLTYLIGNTGCFIQSLT